jgi:hypothetical protein
MYRDISVHRQKRQSFFKEPNCRRTKTEAGLVSKLAKPRQKKIKAKYKAQSFFDRYKNTPILNRGVY